MKQLYLEKKLEEIGKEIEDTCMIKKYKEIVMAAGQTAAISSEDNQIRIFEYEDISVKYVIYEDRNKKHNEDLIVEHKNLEVFSVSNLKLQFVKHYDSLIIESEGQEYLVNTFLRYEGWKEQLSDIYSKIQKDVTTEELKNLEKRFGKLSED